MYRRHEKRHGASMDVSAMEPMLVEESELALEATAAKLLAASLSARSSDR